MWHMSPNRRLTDIDSIDILNTDSIEYTALSLIFEHYLKRLTKTYFMIIFCGPIGGGETA